MLTNFPDNREKDKVDYINTDYKMKKANKNALIAGIAIFLFTLLTLGIHHLKTNMEGEITTEGSVKITTKENKQYVEYKSTSDGETKITTEDGTKITLKGKKHNVEYGSTADGGTKIKVTPRK